MTLLRNKNSNRFCGPAALALIAGIHVDEAAATIRGVTGKRSVFGVTTSTMISALMRHGFSPTRIRLEEHCAPKRPNPTLTGWLRETSDRVKDIPYLVNITGHYIVILGRKMYDNRNPEGVFLGKCPYRRKRVKASWECEKAQKAVAA